MKTKSERLREILTKVRSGQHYTPFKGSWDITEAEKAIIDLFMECVPAEIKLKTKEPLWFEYQARGHFLCRAETLKNIEELRG